MDASSYPTKKIVTRSRFGCLNCRARKKKCNQNKPICESCNKRREICNWPKAGTENINKKRKVNIRFASTISSIDENSVPDIPKSPISIVTNEQKLLTKQDNYTFWKYMSPYHNIASAVLDFDSNEHNLAEYFNFQDTLYSNNQQNQLKEFQYFPLYDTPNYLTYDLGEDEIAYFDYYCNYISKEISVVPQKTNYFLNVFLPIAMREKSVLLCLISWGCIFKNYKLNNVFSKKEGEEIIQRSMLELSASKHDKVDKFIPSLTCYTILMCIEITTGDTDAWSRYLTKSYNLINNMGGFGILKAFSSEGRFLAKSFAYFDILASQSNENGTYYPVLEYTKVFNTEENGGMIDSLQGCTRSLILLLGEVINIVVENKQINAQEMDQELYYERHSSILSRCNKLELRTQNMKISQSDLEILMENGEMEIHLQMFEIYQMTIQLYIKQAVRKIPPIVPEMQSLVFRIKRCLNILIKSRVKPLLGFPLLITGLNSVTLHDKNEIMEAIDIVISTYEFTNIKKIKQVLREVWSLNQNGRLCVDWFEVTKNFGWRLNLGR